MSRAAILCLGVFFLCVLGGIAAVIVNHAAGPDRLPSATAAKLQAAWEVEYRRAEQLARAGRLVEASNVARSNLPTAHRLRDGYGGELPKTLAQLGGIELLQGNFDGAEFRYREAIREFEDINGRYSPGCLRANLGLARALFERGAVAEADSLIVLLKTEFDQFGPNIVLERRQAWRQLAASQLSRGRADAAQDSLLSAEEIALAQESFADTLDTLVLKSLILEKFGQTNEARAALETALAKCEAQTEPPRAERADVHLRLAALLLRQNDSGGAAQQIRAARDLLAAMQLSPADGQYMLNRLARRQLNDGDSPEIVTQISEAVRRPLHALAATSGTAEVAMWDNEVDAPPWLPAKAGEGTLGQNPLRTVPRQPTAPSQQTVPGPSDESALTARERALALLQKYKGPVNVRDIERLRDTAIAFKVRGMLDSTEKSAREALTLSEGHPLIKSLERVELVELLCIALRGQGKFQEAVQVAEAELAKARTTPQTDGVSLARTLNEVGISYLEQGRGEDGEPAFEEALKVLRNTGHQRTLVSAQIWENLSDCRVMTKKYPEALAGISESLRLTAELEAPAGKEYGLRLSKQALARIFLGQFAEAEAEARRAVTILEAHGAPGKLHLAGALNTLGTTLSVLGKGEEACTPMRRSLAIYEQSKSSPTQIEALNFQLGRLLLNLGQLEEAEKHLRRSVELTESFFGPHHLHTAESQRELGRVLVLRKDFAAGESELMKSLAISKSLGDDFGMGRTQDALGTLRMNEQKYSEADVFFRQALANLEKTLGPESGELVPTLEDLGFVNDRLEQASQADAFFDRADAIRAKLQAARPAK